MKGWAARTGIFSILLFAALGTALVLDHERLDSATMDEPFHALAGAEYVLRGTYWANLEHPPLAKLLAGLALKRAGARPPLVPGSVPFPDVESPLAYCFQNSIPVDAVLEAARSPFPALFFLLVVSAGLVAFREAGPIAGSGAALILAFEPTLVAHAGILHTDLAAAFGFFGASVLFVAALRRRSIVPWLIFGAAIGLLLAAKFTGVLLVPILVLVALVHVLRDRRAAGRDRYRPLLGLALSGVVAAAVLLSCYQVALRSMPPAEAEKSVRNFLELRDVEPARIDTVASVSRAFPPAGHYLAGLVGVATQNEKGGGVNVFRGRLSVTGFWDYFLVAFLVKSSLGFLLLLAAALAAGIGRRLRPTFLEAALLAPAIYLFVSGTWASYNIGVRHMLPAVPLLAVAAVLVLGRAFGGRALAVALFACGIIQAAETLAVHPHELSFFNAAAGGPERGSRWLNDSNLDWGQDLVRLARALPSLGIREEDVTVAYFGGDFPPARLPRARDFDPTRPAIGPGVWAVSSFILAAGPETMAVYGNPRASAGYQRLRAALAAAPRIGRVGYSILLFRIPERASQHR